MRDFLSSPTENKHIPFPTLVTNLVEVTTIRGVVREKIILLNMGPITNQTEEKVELLPQGLSPHILLQLFLGLHRHKLAGR